jgi:hypothetical protein
MSGESRVHALLAVARAVAAGAEASGLVRAVAESTGLSTEGVRLGLGVLETDPPEHEIAAFVASAPAAEAVHVILSANVFVAPLRAIAWALASTSRVSVRPSRRDPHLVRALHAAAPSLFALEPDRSPPHVQRGEIHAYGRTETLERIRASMSPGVLLREHGPGLGVALVGEAADLPEAAAALASDVALFDQRGCLSPRITLVLGEAERARAFAEALGLALSDLEARVPRGALSGDEREEASRWSASVLFAGTLLEGRAWKVGIHEKLLVPPSGRHVLVVPCDRLGAGRLLAALSPAITVIGATDQALAAFGPPRARRAALGRMQRPPFDGPVDLRLVPRP